MKLYFCDKNESSQAICQTENSAIISIYVVCATCVGLNYGILCISTVQRLGQKRKINSIIETSRRIPSSPAPTNSSLLKKTSFFILFCGSDTRVPDSKAIDPSTQLMVVLQQRSRRVRRLTIVPSTLRRWIDFLAIPQTHQAFEENCWRFFSRSGCFVFSEILRSATVWLTLDY